jgi:hypothetical protein
MERVKRGGVSSSKTKGAWLVVIEGVQPLSNEDKSGGMVDKVGGIGVTQW